MTPTLPQTEPKITFSQESEGGSTRVELWVEDKAVSRLWVVPFTLRIGRAEVRMDGIGGVGTPDECRNKGYARRMLEGTVEWMAGRDAALTMLYGIPNFYPKFGYATAGPDHYIHLLATREDVQLPEGWTVRGFRPDDLPAVQRIYRSQTAESSGAAVRPDEGSPWPQLCKTPDAESGDEACVVLDPSGRIAAYAWKGNCFWYIRNKLADEYPDAFIVGEAMADSPQAAEAVLAACRLWPSHGGDEGGKPTKPILLSQPPHGHVADAARYLQANFDHHHSRSGDSMARVLNVGRLLSALLPELEVRYRASKSDFTGAVTFQTDIGSATLNVTRDGMCVEEDEGKGVIVSLPQTTLARLALGASPPHDLLDRLDASPDEETRQLLDALFPLRHPHMWIPDRF